MLASVCTTLLLAATLSVARPSAYDTQPYAEVSRARQASANGSGLEVDLGYGIYQGVSNSTTDLNVFLGIRYAAAPTGTLRWQAPVAPSIDRATPTPATSYGAQCPQGPLALKGISPVDNSQSSEDCLFINVWTPNNATSPLPVLVYIHGGGYGEGNGQDDPSTMINTNGNQFVGVSIQYRLGAFGFLSSDEVYRKGVVNAGLLDQHFALQWVRQYISQFNGDPNRVTISGQSAGAGSVMLQSMAYGGSLGTSLFRNAIVASPFLPTQYRYSDWMPTQSYFAFAAAVGCFSDQLYGATGSKTIFECLQSKDSEILINASATISQAGIYGTWAFLPVTDDVFIQDTPSRQLLRKKVNGVNILSGNNANEGLIFVPQKIDSEDELVAWLHLKFPLFSNDDIARILLHYPSSNDTNHNSTLFATTGDSGPTALNQSNVGTGQQQRANNIYAETTFVCPSYWLAEAYSDSSSGQGKAFKYQYSVLPALHGSDWNGYFGQIGTPPYSDSFSRAFQQIWGNFIVNDDPSISQAVAIGQTNGTHIAGNSDLGITHWPPFSVPSPYQIDLNQTGGVWGTLYEHGYPFVAQTGQGAVNDFRQVNAYTWEGGRGFRCDFWRSMGELVPE